MPLVVDASLLVAVHIEEPLSRDAMRVLREARAEHLELHAPELLAVEFANALWKRVGRGDLPAADAMLAIRQAMSLADIDLHPLSSLAPQALALALAHGITAYDACYVALAVAMGGVVVTGDRGLIAHGTQSGLPVVSASAWSL